MDPVWFKWEQKWLKGKIVKVEETRFEVLYTNKRGLEKTIFVLKESQMIKKREEVLSSSVEIPFVDCAGMSFHGTGSRVSDLKEFIITSGASHFKKAFFWTGLLDLKHKFFAFNYTANEWGRAWEEIEYRYDTMLSLYNQGIFDLPLMANIWGMCRRRYMFIMEWFDKNNMDHFVKVARFDDLALKRYLPIFLIELIQSIIDLNNAKIVLCDWKMDQWMVVDARGRLKLNDVDSCYNAYDIAVGKLAHCNCPYEYAPYRDPTRVKRNLEKWLNRTWGNVKNFWKGQPSKFEERVERGKPENYNYTCQSYNDFLWDYGYPIHEYWFQTQRLVEMTWVLMLKPTEVVSVETEDRLRAFANRALDIWNPIKVADYKTEILKILASATELDYEIHEYILRQNRTWTETYLKS